MREGKKPTRPQSTIVLPLRRTGRGPKKRGASYSHHLYPPQWPKRQIPDLPTYTTTQTISPALRSRRERSLAQANIACFASEASKCPRGISNPHLVPTSPSPYLSFLSPFRGPLVCRRCSPRALRPQPERTILAPKTKRRSGCVPVLPKKPPKEVPTQQATFRGSSLVARFPFVHDTRCEWAIGVVCPPTWRLSCLSTARPSWRVLESVSVPAAPSQSFPSVELALY